MKARAKSEDEAIGLRMRERRKLVGFGPQQLAHLLLISTQQLHKYENGMNRIPITHLAKICKILNVSADYLLQGGPVVLASSFKKNQDETTVLEVSNFIGNSKRAKNLHQDQLNTAFRAAEVVNQPETKNMVKGYIAIPDPKIRAALLELVTSINRHLNRRTSL